MTQESGLRSQIFDRGTLITRIVNEARNRTQPLSPRPIHNIENLDTLIDPLSMYNGASQSLVTSCLDSHANSLQSDRIKINRVGLLLLDNALLCICSASTQVEAARISTDIISDGLENAVPRRQGRGKNIQRCWVAEIQRQHGPISRHESISRYEPISRHEQISHRLPRP